MIIAMTIRPTKIGANNLIRKIITAIITINAITPTIIAPIFAVTKFLLMIDENSFKQFHTNSSNILQENSLNICVCAVVCPSVV
jgi:Mg2+/citrate symporter